MEASGSEREVVLTEPVSMIFLIGHQLEDLMSSSLGSESNDMLRRDSMSCLKLYPATSALMYH